MEIKITGRRKLVSIIIYTAMLIILSAAFFTSDMRFVLAALVFGGVCIFCSPVRQRKRKDKIAVILAAVLFILYIFAFPPAISSQSAFKYPVQRAYIGLYKNINEPDEFPDFSEDILSDYKFDYAPSILQGAGHYSVRFTTFSERAAEYAEQFETISEFIIPLSEYGDGLETEDGYIFVYHDREFFVDCPQAVIYICHTNQNFNHPCTFALIADTQSGRIQISQLG
ncbi:MAG: hypothetical protein J6A37_01805 [Oscillospiraceae bacterium]|nr:hypothetical protein [Oscillospiraceae bacterium]